jgi:hypothetical protein
MVIRLIIYFGELVKVALKKGGRKRGGWVKMYGSCWGLWLLCVLVCISVVVVEGACVRDCRVLGLCAVGTVSEPAGGECAGGREG